MKTFKTSVQTTLAALILGAGLFMSGILMPQPVNADIYGGPYEGPTESRDILIDKLVALPHVTTETIETKGGTEVKENITYSYVDNISASQYIFAPHDVVFFKLIVRNTSNVDLTDVVVRDFAPDYVTLFEGPGTVENDTHIIRAGDFAPGQEKEYVIRARIDDTKFVPTGTTCVTNVARAEDDGIADEDTAEFCFNKDREPITAEAIPTAGTPAGLAVMIGSTLIGLAGLRLRRVK